MSRSTPLAKAARRGVLWESYPRQNALPCENRQLYYYGSQCPGQYNPGGIGMCGYLDDRGEEVGLVQQIGGSLTHTLWRNQDGDTIAQARFEPAVPD